MGDLHVSQYQFEYTEHVLIIVFADELHQRFVTEPTWLNQLGALTNLFITWPRNAIRNAGVFALTSSSVTYANRL